MSQLNLNAERLQPTVSVIIVTLDRPECMRRCLRQLSAQTHPAAQIIVVDASAGAQTRQVVGEFPGTIYLRNENGFGRMTHSRNIGLKVASGDVIAFIDDDAFPHPDWLEQLSRSYTGPDAAGVGCVGGRVLDGEGRITPGGANATAGQIGCLKPNGELLGNFDGDPGRTIEVDHVMGCNMSYRSDVLSELGGFREDYPGISGLREDSDMCLRIKRFGRKVLFNPLAKVDHIGAPQAVGRRFDNTYAYYLQRNHLCLLMRNFGPMSGIVWRYIAFSFTQPAVECFRRIGAAMMKLVITFAATIWGAIFGAIMVMRLGKNPVRSENGPKQIKSIVAQSITPAATDASARPL